MFYRGSNSTCTNPTNSHPRPIKSEITLALSLSNSLNVKMGLSSLRSCSPCWLKMLAGANAPDPCLIHKLGPDSSPCVRAESVSREGCFWLRLAPRSQGSETRTDVRQELRRGAVPPSRSSRLVIARAATSNGAVCISIGLGLTCCCLTLLCSVLSRTLCKTDASP
jgi:hypothetical protein